MTSLYHARREKGKKGKYGAKTTIQKGHHRLKGGKKEKGRLHIKVFDREKGKRGRARMAIHDNFWGGKGKVKPTLRQKGRRYSVIHHTGRFIYSGEKRGKRVVCLIKGYFL